MTRYRDPQAPAGRVVFGSVEFIDGVTGDIEISPEAARLFEGAGITAVEPDEAQSEPEKSASRRGK